MRRWSVITITFLILAAAGITYLGPSFRGLVSEGEYSQGPSASSEHTPAKPPDGWNTYISDEYKFQFSYPTDSFYGGLLVPGCNTRSSFFATRLRCVANLWYLRGPGGDEQFQTVIISVGDKYSSSTLPQWVSAEFNDDLRLRDIPKGGIADALTAAYDSQKEVHKHIGDAAYIPPAERFVTYNTRTEGGVASLELGAVLDSGGKLSYTTLLTKDGVNYVYSIELLLQPGEFGTRPSDRELIDMYKGLIHSLRMAMY